MTSIRSHGPLDDQAAPARSPHLFGLDLLRILAAAAVLLNHFGAYGWRTVNASATGADRAFPALAPFVETGAIGVEVFFVISGFVIAMSAAGGRSARFAWGRVVRIAPALWVCATIALLVRLAGGEPLMELTEAWLRTVLLSPDGPYIDGVVWTLVVEAAFYGLVFAAMLAGPRLSLDRLAVLIGGASTLFIALFAHAVLSGGPHAGLLARFPFEVLLLRHGAFFAVGMMLHSIHRHGDAPWKRGALSAFVVASLLEITVSAGASAIAECAIWLVALGAIAASIRHADAIAAAVGGRGTLVRDLGRLSYPLYLNHYTLGMVLVPALFALGLAPVPALAVALALVVGSSWLVVRGPERWGQAVLRRAAERHGARTRVPLVARAGAGAGAAE